MANFVDQVNKAEGAVKKAKADHVSAVNNAQKLVKKAEGVYFDRIKAIEKEIDSAERAYTAKVDSFAGITLYRDHIKGNDQSFKLDSSVVVKLDVGGKVQVISATAGASQDDYSASTQVMPTAEKLSEAASEQGGAANAAAASDQEGVPRRIENEDRIYVIVGSSRGRIGAQVKSEKEQDARVFATSIAKTAAVAESVEQEKNSKIDQLRAQLAQVKNETGEIEKAKANLEAVEADESAVIQAENALVSLMGSASKKNLVALSEHQMKRRKRNRTIILILVALVIIAIIIIAILLNMQ